MHDIDQGLVGREAELARLGGAIAAASAGSPTFLLVTGEAGIGKTRLLRAAVDLATRAGVRTLWGTAIESGRSIPYLPLIAPLRAAAADEDAGGQGGRRVPDDSATALQRALAGGAHTAADQAQGTSLDTARFMEGAFDVLARRPTLLVVDDAQWADASTLTVLDYLAHRSAGAPLLVLAAARDEEPATLARLPIADGRVFERLSLARLSEREVGRQAAAVVGTAVPARRVASLFRRTAGNPFFVEQVLAQGTAAHGAPASLRALVMRRIATLDGETRRALDALAIIGRPSVPERIAAVAGLAPAEAEAALEVAAAAGVIVPDEAGIMLRHPLFGEVIEGELTGPERRRLHAAAAAESEAAGDADPAVIANHWWQARDPARAWPSALAAAAAAERAFAFAEARLHLERALEAWPGDEPGQADALLRAGRAAWLVGDPEAALAFARRSDALEPGRIGAVVAIGSYAWDAGHRAEAVDAFGQVSALLGPGADPALQARAEWGMGRAAVVSGHPEDAVGLGLAASHRAAAIGDLVLQSEGLALAAMARAFAGGFDGVAWLDQAVDVALRSGATYCTGHAFQFLVDLRGLAGDADDALTAAMRGIDVCSRLGLARTHGSDLRGRAALLLLERGRLGDAAAVLEPADERAFPALARAFVAMRRGELDAAGTALEAAASGGAIGGPGALGGWLELAQVELAWLRGDGPGAARWLEAVPSVPGVWGADVSAWAARWRARTGSGDAAALVAAAERHPDPRVRTALTLEVRAATASAHPHDAWARAAVAWLEAARPWEAAWSTLAEAEARFAARDSGGGKAALDSALATAMAMGAEPLRSQVEELARRARIRVGPHARQRAQPDEPTERELQVLALLAEGLTNPQIAERLFLSPKTVGIHVSRLLDKLGAHTRGEAVAVARRRGLLD